MIICPNPDCNADLELFQVEARISTTGQRLYVDCPECDTAFEVQVLVLDTVEEAQR